MKIKTLHLTALYLCAVFLLMSCSDDDVQTNKYVPGGVMPAILVVGQSNAEGWAPISSAPQWLADSKYRLENYGMWNPVLKQFQTYQLGVNVGSGNNADTKFAFDVFFAKAFLNDNNDKLLCIKHAMNGAPISEKGHREIGRWQPKTELIPDGERKLAIELAQKLQDAKDFAQKHNTQLKIIAILYHQGETDAYVNERLVDYEVNFKNLITYIRGIAGSETIPVINAEVLPFSKNSLTLNSLFFQMNESDPYLKTVSMAGHYTHIGDRMHFDAAAFEYMGTKMYEYYKEIK